jgi:hypothetical protein
MYQVSAKLERAYALYLMARADARKAHEALLRAQEQQARALFDLQEAKEEKEREHEVAA